jgi:hypothetical protein
MERPGIGGLRSVINLKLWYPINNMAAIIQQPKTNLCRLPDIFVRVIFTFFYHFRISKTPIAAKNKGGDYSLLVNRCRGIKSILMFHLY